MYSKAVKHEKRSILIVGASVGMPLRLWFGKHDMSVIRRTEPTKGLLWYAGCNHDNDHAII